MRTAGHLYIRNFEPDTWRTGEVEGKNPTYDFGEQPWPTEPGAFSFNIDPSPSKQSLRLDRESAEARLVFARRPKEELYDLDTDPDQLHNLAGEKSHRDTLERLRVQLTDELRAAGDPRIAE